MIKPEIDWHIEKRRICDLFEFAKNPRRVKKERFKKMVESVQQDGYHDLIRINLDNTIISGHQRRKALFEAGYSKNDEINVLVPGQMLSQDEIERMVIRGNVSAGDWDEDILANQWDQDKLLEWGMPGDLLPKAVDEIAITAEDDELPASGSYETRCKLGDVWQLGEHRLMCGDSTNPLNVQDLCIDFNPNLMVTDPPYGVNYDASWREGLDEDMGKRSTGKVLNYDRVDWTDAYSLFTGNVVYIWHAGLHTHEVAQHLINLGFNLTSQIIWAKQHFVFSRCDYHWQHEPCWYAVKKGSKHFYNGQRDQKTLWEIKNNGAFGNANKEETVGHSTQKPIECMLRPIINNSKPSDYIYDPFGGSGTTLIACEISERKCLMMELSPNYCDIIIARWEKHSKQMAELVQ